MSYKCSDCSYKGTQLSQGYCPACGSPCYRRINRVYREEDTKRLSTLKILLLISLWLSLAYLVYEKL